MKNIELPFNVEEASKETVDFLLKIGVLYVGEDGELHCTERGE